MTGGPGQPIADEITDTMLVTAVRAGDTEAFDLLYRRHAPAVRRAVAGLIRDSYRVDDAVQEAFARALERLGDLRDPERLGPWLKTIARNAATDSVRGHPTSDLDGVPEARLEDSATPTDEAAEIRELAALVDGAMAELGPRDAKALAMAGYLNASPAEIGAELGVTAGAAKVALHRARARLRVALKIKVLVRGRAGACVEFADRVASSNFTEAARHVVSCVACARAGSVALRLYAPPPDTAAPAAIAVEVSSALGTRTVALREELWVGRECADAPIDRRLIVDDPQVSRTHLRLEVDPQSSRVRVTDVSRNGTQLNGAELPAGSPVVLWSGDRLQVGDTALTLRQSEAVAAQPAETLMPATFAGLTSSIAVSAMTAQVTSSDNVPPDVTNRLGEAGRLLGALVDHVPGALLLVRWPAGEELAAIESRHRHFVEFAQLLGERAGVHFVVEVLPARL